MPPFRSMLFVLLACAASPSWAQAQAGGAANRAPKDEKPLLQTIKLRVDHGIDKAQALWDGSNAQRLALATVDKTKRVIRLSAGLLTELGDKLEAKGLPGVAWMRRGSPFAWPGFIWTAAEGDRKAMGAMIGGSSLINWTTGLTTAFLSPLAGMIVAPTMSLIVFTFDASTLLLRQHYLREVKGKGLTKKQALAKFTWSQVQRTRLDLQAERHAYTAKRQRHNRQMMKRWRAKRAMRAKHQGR